MRNLRWQLIIAIGGVALIIGLFLGQNPRLETTAPQPVAGGAYTEALLGKLVRLNPVLDANNQVDKDIDRLIFSGLISFDSRGNPQPDLAELAVSADATLYTFTIRERAFWHDGEPVTSDDVIYTFSKFQDEDYPGSKGLQAFWKDINIVRLDTRTVQFQLPEPFAPFLDYVSIGLLPDHLLRGVSVEDLIDHPFNLHPIGTGPFKFDRFLTENGEIVGVSLRVSEDYYGEQPFLERIEFRIFDEAAEALRAYRAGEVQGIGAVDASILEAALDQPNLNLYSSRLPRIGLVFLNTKHPELTFFREKAFRQALQLSINRQWIVDSAFRGQAVIADSPILPGTWAHADDLRPTVFDPQTAGELLLSLGWELPAGAAPGTPEYIRTKDGQALAFELVYADNSLDGVIAEALRENWAAVGIEVDLTAVPPASLLEDYLEPRDYDAALTELNLSRFPDPDPYPFWHDSQSEAGQNFSGFSDRNISIWIERARTSPDFAQRADLYRNFQFRFMDQVPALLLYHPVHTFVIDSSLQGVSVGPVFDPSDRYGSIRDWYLLVRRSPAAGPTVEPGAGSP